MVERVFGRVVVAPDKFKGSLSAPQAAIAITRGIDGERRVIEIVEHPIADGGEGTVDMFLANGFTALTVEAPGPAHHIGDSHGCSALHDGGNRNSIGGRLGDAGDA